MIDIPNMSPILERISYYVRQSQQPVTLRHSLFVRLLATFLIGLLVGTWVATSFVTNLTEQSSQPAETRYLGSVANYSYYFLNESEVESLRADYTSGTAASNRYWLMLKNAADRDLLGTTIETIPSKGQTPPSGDRRDYWSWPKYVWYNSSTGAYEYRDGQPNTEMLTQIQDSTNLQAFYKAVTSGAFAWTISQDSRYSTAVANLMRTWIIQPETRLNPNLSYAQFVEGYTSPTRTNSGIIEINFAYELWDAFAVALQIPELSTSEKASITTWLESFYTWLTTNSGSIKESKTVNNHSVYWHLTTSSLAAVHNRRCQSTGIRSARYQLHRPD